MNHKMEAARMARKIGPQSISPGYWCEFVG